MNKNKKRISLLLCCVFSSFSFATLSNEVASVSVVYPKAAQNNQKLMLAGTVEATKNADLAVLESGVVAELFVDVGDSVSKGQALLQLDNKLAKYKLRQIASEVSAKNVELIEAKRLHQEVLVLSKKQLVAQTLIEERKAAIAVAKANLEQAKAQRLHQQELVARYSLKAPFTGIIAKRNIDLGEWATPQQPVFNLVGQSELRVKIEIPQEYLSSLSRGKASVEILPSTQIGQRISGSIDRLVTIANELSRTMTGYVNLSDSTELVAGMSVNVEILLPKTEQSVVWLPKAAVKQHPDGGRSVFAVVNNKSKRYLVEVVNQNSMQVAVSGVPSDLPIIATGIELLRDNTAVNITSTSGN